MRIKNPARGETTLFVFTTDVYSLKFNLKYNIMIQSDSFIVLNQVFLTDADAQNGKKNKKQIDSCLRWYTAEAKQRANWLFKRSGYKNADCRVCLSADAVCHVKGWKALLVTGELILRNLTLRRLFADCCHITTITRWQGPKRKHNFYLW